MNSIVLFALDIILVYILHYAAAAQSDQWPPDVFEEKMRPVIQECTIKWTPNSELLGKLLEGAASDNDLIKKLMLCIFDAFGIVEHISGEIHYYKLLDLLATPAQKRQAFENGKHCLGIHEALAEDTANLFVMCLQKYDSQIKECVEMKSFYN